MKKCRLCLNSRTKVPIQMCSTPFRTYLNQHLGDRIPTKAVIIAQNYGLWNTKVLIEVCSKRFRTYLYWHLGGLNIVVQWKNVGCVWIHAPKCQYRCVLHRLEQTSIGTLVQTLRRQFPADERIKSIKSIVCERNERTREPPLGKKCENDIASMNY